MAAALLPVLCHEPPVRASWTTSRTRNDHRLRRSSKCRYISSPGLQGRTKRISSPGFTEAEVLVQRLGCTIGCTIPVDIISLTLKSLWTRPPCSSPQFTYSCVLWVRMIVSRLILSIATPDASGRTDMSPYPARSSSPDFLNLHRKPGPTIDESYVNRSVRRPPN